MQAAAELNRAELRRYLDRVGDRWPIERAILGGARVADLQRNDSGAARSGSWTTRARPEQARQDAERAASSSGSRAGGKPEGPPQRERGPEFVLILVSAAYDGMPWLERVYQAGALWDALEMGAPADIHCYTPVEFERKRATLPVVRDAAEHGLDLSASS